MSRRRSGRHNGSAGHRYESHDAQEEQQMLVSKQLEEESFVPESSLARPEDAQAAADINAAIIQASPQTKPHPQQSAQYTNKGGKLGKQLAVTTSSLRPVVIIRKSLNAASSKERQSIEETQSATSNEKPGTKRKRGRPKTSTIKSTQAKSPVLGLRRSSRITGGNTGSTSEATRAQERASIISNATADQVDSNPSFATADSTRTTRQKASVEANIAVDSSTEASPTQTPRHVGVQIHRGKTVSHVFDNCKTKTSKQFVELCIEVINKFKKSNLDDVKYAQSLFGKVKSGLNTLLHSGKDNENSRGDQNSEDDENSEEEENSEVDEDDKDYKKYLVQDAYTMVIPKLSELLKAVYTAYGNEVLASRDNSIAMSFKQSDFIRGIAETIINFEAQIRAWGIQPATDLPIKRPIKTHAIAPLKEICRTLNRALHRERESRKLAADQARIKADLEARAIDDECELAESRSRYERYKFWSALNQLRLDVEKNPRRRPFLCVSAVPSNDNIGLDANGDPFERIGVFGERTTARPLLEAVEMRNGSWSEEQLDALLWSLEHESSEEPLLLFKCIFARWCGAGGVLQDFNCEEIYGMAKYMKALLMEEEAMDGLEERDWVRRIPSRC
ncbi:hypothetical protein EJ05DRAFT_278182 [Pseudovirgaria hyperparasitica]|uniref:Uncharacterized protein n=1 Tax=Pseudovirgaria hyperparasitica TaxID=470096 RepID=A0A6A6WDZ1_9PEZI|nr:uncharacterized protein EJ05DRAFT_278182 [Pseudovirgaria hyperparasitica]KAF2760274.1 hypothetical protein EJ05DRAFT_278182 [Pseudovirgaria hyperparasitica]